MHPHASRFATFTARLIFCLATFAIGARAEIPLNANDTVLFYGGGMVERLCEHGEMEARVQLARPGLKLRFRSLAWTGDEVGHRLRPEGYVEHLKNLLAKWPANVVVVGYGLNESFAGEAGLADFRTQLDAHLSQLARIHPGAKFVVLSPIAIEGGTEARNRDVELYAKALAEAAAQRGTAFVDLFAASRAAYAKHSEPLTDRGLHLNDAGAREMARVIARAFVGEALVDDARLTEVAQAAAQKSRFVADVVRPKNAVVYFGVRKRQDEYDGEIPRYHQLIEKADDILREIVSKPGAKFANFPRPSLPPLGEGKSNKDRFGAGTIKPPAEQQAEIKVADGYALNLFASEAEFPDLKNPVQIAFDARGRLWVVTMPTWPHTVPGEAPKDKVLILEDTNRDGKADQQTIFADGLDALDGIAFHQDGVIVSAQPRLLLLRDSNGDGRADQTRELLRGVDVTDSHHGGMVSTDPLGHVLFCDGVFHRSQFETPFGVVRGIDATTYRLDPATGRVWVEYQTMTPNPWKITFDRWGNVFQMYGGGHFLDELQNTWTPLGVAHPYGDGTVLNYGKGSGAAIVSSPNFPDDAQQGFVSATLLGNYFVALSRRKVDAGAIVAADRLDLLSSPNAAFRPVDLAFGLDGALYVSDFSSAIIGHAQHPMRDPQWDHEHGRIWRVVNTAKPLVKDWPRIEGASVPELLALLTHPQDLVRHHARIELRKADATTELERWIAAFDRAKPEFDQAALEALWLLHSKGEVRPALLGEALKSKDPMTRAAAVALIRFQADRLDAPALLHTAAADPNPRVRIAVLNVVSHLRVAMPQVEHALHALKSDEPPVQRMLASLKAGTKSTKGRSVPVLEVAPGTELTSWLRDGASFDPKAKGKPDGVFRTFVEATSAQPAILAVKHGFLDVNVNGVQLLSSDTQWSSEQQVQLDLRPGLNVIEIAFRKLRTGAPPAVRLYDPLGQRLAAAKTATDTPALLAFAAAWEKANADLGSALRIQAVPNQMKFAPVELRAKAGAKLRIVFENPDLMAHNFLLCAPDSAEEIGALADAMALQPDGLAKQYIPASPKVLHATPLVQPTQKAELTFTAPAEPGRYPYLCTFPGHWRVMRGVLVLD
jgi:glucose/arabinose dehydrogenase/azurin